MAADDDEAESNSIVDKIKKQLPFLAKLIPAKKKPSKANDDDSTDPSIGIQDEDDEEEDGKKSKKKAGGKKPNKIIYIVVGLGLAFLFAEDFLPKDEVVEAPPVAQTPKKKSQRELDKEAAVKKAAEGGATETPAATEAPAETETPAVTETPAETPTETPAVEEPAVTETPTPTEETIPVIENPVTPETPTDITSTLTEEEPVIVEEPVITMEPDTVDPSLATPNDNAAEDQIGMPGDSTTGSGDFTDKILQDLEKQAQDKEKTTPKKRDYVSPPDYDYVGRGLVYNCVGKHWACVDAPSYKTCEQNHDANKALNKKVECYPFNVYEKPKNCQASQLMMTSSNAKTGFCNE